MRSCVRVVVVVLDGEGNLIVAFMGKAAYAYGVMNGRSLEYVV